jgi:hypothetical protein
MKRLVLLLMSISLVLFSISLSTAEEIRSAGYAGTPVKASWSLPSTWLQNVVPGPNDDVIITDGDTVFLDVTTGVTSITVGDGASGALIFNSATSVNLTVTGNILINAGGTFRTTTDATVTTAPLIDTLFISGDFINDGACIDFRRGSAPNYGICYVVFVGPNNSNFRSNGRYNSNTNEFNGITINKSGTGRVILGSDITLAGGSSTYPATQPYFDLIHGIVVTNDYSVVCYSTASQVMVVGGSKESYILGSLGRGMSSGSTATRFFPLGDEDGYRPIRVRNASGGNATGHFLRVRAIRGDANVAGSITSPDIDKISTVRYYKLTYDRDTSIAAPSMYFDRFFPSYGEQDGVAEGNSNLRIAYTTDSLINWKSLGQVAHVDTTVFSDPPEYWNADSLPLGSMINLQADGASAFIAIARATGTTENSLVFTPVGVEEGTALPEGYSLLQNYPNPFNPSTLIEFSVPRNGRVTLEIFNLLGQSVGVLVDADLMAGSYKIPFNASGISSGVYGYRLSTPAGTMTKKMIFAR